MTSLKIGSLFSGYGGLDLAVEQMTGGKIVWHVENAKAPSAILERNFPGIPNYKDVAAVDWNSVEPIDILTGGFPCQDLSLAGKRAGLGAGTRSGLWIEMLEAIETLKPRLVIIENVRGLLNTHAHSNMELDPASMVYDERQPILRAMGLVSGSLSDVGYDSKWIALRASDAGSCHNRLRVFIIANRTIRAL